MGREAGSGPRKGDSPLFSFGQLFEIPDLSHARGLLEAYAPANEEQEKFLRDMLAWIDRYPQDAHRRSRLEGHLTASALVLDHDRKRALLTFHKKLNCWLQLGGHCDGDASLVRVALREAIEESGIPDLVIDPRPIDLDIHPIPARPGEPMHLHLDTRFLVYAPKGAQIAMSEESLDLRWFLLAHRGAEVTDESVRRLFRVACQSQGF